jgi:nitroreductase
MDINSAVMERRSIRQFKKEPVSEKIIQDILEKARWSPSWGNTQPWEIYVVTGEKLENFKKENKQKLLNGIPPTPEVEMPQNWPDILKKRYIGIGKTVLTSLSIPREDKQARLQYGADMFFLFSAPCLLLFCVDKSLPVSYAFLDVGLILQTICLLAHENGLGTCILAASVSYPQILRQLIPIPQNKTIAIGAAIGYPDFNAPVNKFERERAPLNEFVTWIK